MSKYVARYVLTYLPPMKKPEISNRGVEKEYVEFSWQSSFHQNLAV